MIASIYKYEHILIWPQREEKKIVNADQYFPEKLKFKDVTRFTLCQGLPLGPLSN
jgi:hypothetical protein